MQLMIWLRCLVSDNCCIHILWSTDDIVMNSALM